MSPAVNLLIFSAALATLAPVVVYLIYADYKARKRQEACEHRHTHRYVNLRVCCACGARSYGSLRREIDKRKGGAQ